MALYQKRMVRGAGLEPARFFTARDFKSLVSTNSTTRAYWALFPILQTKLKLFAELKGGFMAVW